MTTLQSNYHQSMLNPLPRKQDWTWLPQQGDNIGTFEKKGKLPSPTEVRQKMEIALLKAQIAKLRV